VIEDPFAAAETSAARLAEATGHPTHDVAVVLGSGWAPAADAVGKPDAEVPLSELGGFPAPTVAGHRPTARSVSVGGRRVLLFLGRVHLYEGLLPSTVVHGVRTAIMAGARCVVLTNAAGGIRKGLSVGQPVLISDHLNLTGKSPLSGPPPTRGQRFVDLTEVYSPRLRQLARDADPELTEGVYAMMPGPHYETPAEISMLARIGADLVGMSTALEAIAARQLDTEVMGISLVTNLAAGLTGQALSHEEVVEAGKASAARMGTLLAAVLPRI
jgi:purine-nucleoside phosphorylase